MKSGRKRFANFSGIYSFPAHKEALTLERSVHCEKPCSGTFFPCTAFMRSASMRAVCIAPHHHLRNLRRSADKPKVEPITQAPVNAYASDTWQLRSSESQKTSVAEGLHHLILASASPCHRSSLWRSCFTLVLTYEKQLCRHRSTVSQSGHASLPSPPSTSSALSS